MHLEKKMQKMKTRIIVAAIAFLAASAVFRTDAATRKTDAVTGATTDSSAVRTRTGKDTGKGFMNRLTIGGYGEAVMSYNMYSDNFGIYSSPEAYKDSKGHGRFDIPHAVLMLGYDFGKGWKLGMEIEFEHGGVEAAVERENGEAGEFEKEIERGGEVALEQFWIEKSFFPQLNVRAGHIIVPVGLTNSYHLPTEFFTVYRPEGENTIIPCTWHETGISVWGRAGDWRYEALMVAGLNSTFFSTEGWVHDGSASPYEFKPASQVAGAFRVDNYSVDGLRLGLSGYIGNSFHNDITTNTSDQYAGVNGTVMIGAFDFVFDRYGFIARGNFDYGYLSDIGYINRRNSTQNHTTSSPYANSLVGKAAICAGIEAGYDFFSLSERLKASEQKFYVFARYEYYDSYIPASGTTPNAWTDKHRIAAGINYYPIPEVGIKAEYSHRFLKSPYNPEPSVSLGVVWAAYFMN